MAEMTDMRKDVDWYYANLDSLLPIYNGKYLAIADGQLLGDFDECIDGVRAMESAGRKRGTYIVHKCIPLEQERREWYYRSNRVRFGVNATTRFFLSEFHRRGRAPCRMSTASAQTILFDP